MKFRIRSITIEGFKGFTNPQTIPILGKHVFLFGPNGYGKSSIVEAIRWCLFGLTGRPEEIVRNQFYGTGDCAVEMELESPDGLWRIQRRLTSGSARSRMSIFDPQGRERTKEEVFPFLTSLGPREGTYIIFGGPSQFPSRRRPLESIEISDFGKIIYAYLRLEEVPDLIERLNGLIEVQKEAEHRVAEEIQDEERKIADKLEEKDRRLSLLLQDPPWGEAEPPTWEQTKDKVKELVNRLVELKGEKPPETLNEEDLLTLARDWVRALAAPKESELNEQVLIIREQQNKVRTLQRELEEKNQAITDIERKIEEVERKRREILGTSDSKQLFEELRELNRKIEQTSLRVDIAKKLKSYYDNYEFQECLTCSAKVDQEELKSKVAQLLEQAKPEQLALFQHRDQLEALLEELTQLQEQFETASQRLQEYQQECVGIEASLKETLDFKDKAPLTPVAIKSFLNTLEARIEEMEQTLESEQKFYREWERRMERIRGELRFHRYRDEKDKLERLMETRLEPIREHYTELVELRESLEEVREALASELAEVLKHVLPSISEMMTEVYEHLTQQVSFDRIQIMLEDQSRSFSPKLLVRVGSSNMPDLPPLDPEQVLNGQALNALRLVPYFVFSKFQKETWGLDLLLLDDPTQSFDAGKIEFLMEELHTAANHAQLVISTHEEDRFNPLLSKFFPEDQMTILHVTGFEPEKGPCLEMG